MLLLYRDQVHQSRRLELAVAGHTHIGHFVFLALGDDIDDGVHRILTVELRVDVDVKESFLLKIRDQRLTAFLHQLGIDPYALINRQQRFFGPAPKVRTLHLDVNRRARLHIEVDIGAVGLRGVGCPREFHLCSQLVLFLQALLQILLGIGQGLATVVLSRPDGRSPHPRLDALQALGHLGGLFRSGIGDRHRAEFRFAIQTHQEPYIGHVMAGVQVYLGTNLGFKIPFLLKEAQQRVAVLLDVAGVEGRLRRIIRDLH